MGNKSNTISPETILASQSAINSNSGNNINNHYIDNNLIKISLIYGGIHLSIFILDKIFIWVTNKQNQSIGEAINNGINIVSDSFKEGIELRRHKSKIEIRMLELQQEEKEFLLEKMKNTS